MRKRLLRACLLLFVLVVFSQPVLAYRYYSPFPAGRTGLSRPVMGQHIILDPEQRFVRADMWLDGQSVPATWDGPAGYVRYAPVAPLAPGVHHVRLVVETDCVTPGYYYEPLVSEFYFTVAADAVSALPEPDPECRLALDYLNTLRAASGLPAMSYGLSLGQAAQRHARYLIDNPSSPAHEETPGTPGFCGAGPKERCEFWGYTGGASEVVAYEGPAEAAVDAWMETIYHRIPLVHPGNTELGYGYSVADDGSERSVNVINCGPAEDAAERETVAWPYPGQTGVRTSWDGLESPDPLRLYPGTVGPVGYTVTLTLATEPKILTLTSWSLTGSDGSRPEVMTFAPTNDDKLRDTVSLIAYKPLAPLTTYAVRLAGTVDYGRGAEAYDKSWAFTTGPGELEVGPRWSYRLWQTGDSIRISTEGLRVRKGVRVFVNGLEVRNLAVASRNEVSFRLPAGFGGGAGELLFVAGDGLQESGGLPDDIDAASGKKAFVPVRVVLPGGGPDVSGLALGEGGPVMVPESTLEALGATAFRAEGLNRTHWIAGGRSGCVTTGSPVALVGGSRLLLRLAQRTVGGVAYVPVEFVEALLRTTGVFPDMVGHWANEAVERLAGLGIVAGMGDGRFQPGATLTRAAFLKMLVKAGRLELQPGEAGGFSDTGGHWVSAQGFLGPALGAGIIKAADYEDGRFFPDQSITREEIAVMVMRAMGFDAEAAGYELSLDGGVAVFGGVRFGDAGLWTRPGYVALAVEQEIVRGYKEADGSYTFRATGQATRAEAATMVCRMLDKLGR